MTTHTIALRGERLAAAALSAADWVCFAAAPDLRNHGTACGRSWWWPAGYALLGHARCITAEWNGLDVYADEYLSFGPLAEADFQPTKTAPARPILSMRAGRSGRSRNNGAATAFDRQHAVGEVKSRRQCKNE
jgi:hypothetical protein